MPQSPSRDDQTPCQPMAGGRPISETIADQAAEWLTLMMSGEVAESERRQWLQWRAAHPDHEHAWNHIEAVTQRLKALDPCAGRHALSSYPESAPVNRRKALNLLLWGGVAGAVGAAASQTPYVRRQAADHHADIGEQRTVTLQDGSLVTLNTASAINVCFDDQSRALRLIEGEAFIVTAHAPGRPDDHRPFVVETGEGSVSTASARFGVRQQDGFTTVSVREGAVKISPISGNAPCVAQAGERTLFTRASAQKPRALSLQDDAWLRGQIVAENMPLKAFLAELGRYRPGLLRCAPEVAELRLSGVFPVRDTDRILATLPSALPVRVRSATRWWVTIEAAS